MYRPRHFQENDPTKVHALIKHYGLATVITCVDGRPTANHLPLILDASRGPLGVLLGHMARTNPQWRDFERSLESGQSILCVFNGPDSYISPSWYIDPLNVPTWNYAAVHVCGRARIIHEPESIESILKRQVAAYESHLDKPWNYELPEDFRNQLLKAIVGFEIEIESIEGKFKLSQNRSEQDKTTLLAHLHQNQAYFRPDFIAIMEEEHAAKSR